MTSDLNRNITEVDYNILNLTQKVSQASGDVYYVYTATGRKLSKHSTVETRNYISGLEFTTKIAGLLPEFIATEEGRLLVDNATTYTYEYTIADHLGNARVTFKVNALYQPILGNHYKVYNYYPFGLVMEGDGMASAANNTEPHNNYQFNSKELQTETGWNDFGARMYDASIGRWMVVDPLAEHPNQISKSPYQYAWNNPINLVDPDGMCPDCLTGARQVGTEAKVQLGSNPSAQIMKDVDAIIRANTLGRDKSQLANPNFVNNAVKDLALGGVGSASTDLMDLGIHNDEKVFVTIEVFVKDDDMEILNQNNVEVNDSEEDKASSSSTKNGKIDISASRRGVGIGAEGSKEDSEGQENTYGTNQKRNVQRPASYGTVYLKVTIEVNFSGPIDDWLPDVKESYIIPVPHTSIIEPKFR